MDGLTVADDLVEHDVVLAQEAPEAGGHVLRRGPVGRGKLRPGDGGGVFRVLCRDARPARFDPRGERRVEPRRVYLCGELLQRGAGAALHGALRADVPERDVLLDGVDVQTEDPAAGGRGDADGPGEVAVDGEDDVRPLHERGVVAEIELVVGRVVHGDRVRLQHRDGEAAAERRERADRGSVAPKVGRDDERALRGGEGGEQDAGALLVEPDGGDRLPGVRPAVDPPALLLQRFARRGQVDRALRLAAGELQGAVDVLLDVEAAAQLGAELRIAADDPRLIAGVLDELDVGVAAAGELALHRVRGEPGEDEHRHAAAERIVQRAAHVLGPDVHVDEDRLRRPADLGVALRGADGGVFVRRDDDLRHGLAERLVPRPALDDRRVIRPEIGEDAADAGPLERVVEQVGRGAASGQIGHVGPSFLRPRFGGPERVGSPEKTQRLPAGRAAARPARRTRKRQYRC